MGGVLTSWATPEEQADVEQYFISKVWRPYRARCTPRQWCLCSFVWLAAFLVSRNILCVWDKHRPNHTRVSGAAAQGILIPEFHKAYWFGLTKSSSNAPNFTWYDPYVVFQQSSGNTYSHWGTFVGPSGTAPEPNNLRPPELCAVANYTEEYDGAWGWADTRCSTNFTFICKIIREQPHHNTA
jgi:hypothetical protein